MASDPQPARSASVSEVDFRTTRNVGSASGADSGGFGARSDKDSFSWQESAGGGSSRRRFGFVPGLLIGVAVIGLGVAVWYAYQWGLERGYSEEVPIIQASTGPYKVRPNAPGGLVVPDQDKLVLNQDGTDEGAPQVERLLSAPETPQPPQTAAEADGTAGAAGADAGDSKLDAVTEVQETVTTVPELKVPLPEAEPEASATQSAQAPAPEASESAAAAPAPQAAPAASAEPEAAAAGQAPAQAAPTQQAAATKEPSVTIQAAQPSPSEASAATEATGGGGGAGAAPKLQLAAVKDGDYVIQLASVTSDEAAKTEWARLRKSFPDLLGDMNLAVQRATVKGTEYHRVQTGPFPSRATALDMCAQLKAQNQPCIVQQR